MNARKSLLLWMAGSIIFAGCVLGFAHGAQLIDAEPLQGAAWMLGSVGVLVLEVFAAVKLNTSKK